jgi:hypothetical protein
MPLRPLLCPKCQRRIEFIGGWQACPRCSATIEIEVFPAFFKENAPGQAGEILLLDGESSCFYHPDKKAILHCDGCGRFVCALCDCELRGQHFCPRCLEAGKSKGKIRNLENSRILYDTISLALVVLPVITLLFWFLTIVTAPIALFVAIRYWNAPRSILRRTKLRYVIAMVVATVEMGAWALLFYAIYSGVGRPSA